MKKYRFKKREEFIRDSLWSKEDNCPHEWAWGGEMNKYLGTDVPEEFNIHCNENEEFQYDGWYFKNTNYVLKEQQEYFSDLSQHIGRYIRALVDYPHGGRVKKGDVGKIISNYDVNFSSQQGYSCSSALSKKHLGVNYELLPEDYSPEQKPNVEFIPGKWYNFTTMKGEYNLYVKVSSVTDKSLFFMNGKSISNGHFGEADCIDIKLIENPRLVEDLSEIQKYLPNEHPDKVKNFKPEVGKWYSFNWDYSGKDRIVIAKIKKVEEEYFAVSWRSYLWLDKSYSDSDAYRFKDVSNIKELSIKEIQPYLPIGHPDKITSDVFKKGEYIVITDSCSGRFCTNYIYKQKEDYKYLRSELDNYGSTTNGWETIGKKDSHTWRYATQEEIDEYERRGKPYDVTELQKKQLSIEEIQEECKKRFPIGCTFTNTKGETNVLRNDSCTYAIIRQTIWAHFGGSLLYADGKYATLISLPEENITEIPEYIECTETQESYFIKGNVYKVIDSKNLASARLVSNIELSQISAGTHLFCSMEINDKKYWKPSTKEKYDQQKPLTYESVSGCFPTDKTMLIHDEVRQYPLTPSECWKNIPKFEKQKEFDIYGPTPDIE